MSNEPPHSILYLNQGEHEYLASLLSACKGKAAECLSEVAAMPSSDERAAHRSLLVMAAAADVEITSHLVKKLEQGRGAV